MTVRYADSGHTRLCPYNEDMTFDDQPPRISEPTRFRGPQKLIILAVIAIFIICILLGASLFKAGSDDSATASKSNVEGAAVTASGEWSSAVNQEASFSDISFVALAKAACTTGQLIDWDTVVSQNTTRGVAGRCSQAAPTQEWKQAVDNESAPNEVIISSLLEKLCGDKGYLASDWKPILLDGSTIGVLGHCAPAVK